MTTTPPSASVVRCVLLGGGGHASVLIECLERQDGTVIVGLLEPDRQLWGTTFLGVPILGGDSLLPELTGRGATHFVVAIGGVGNNRPRQRLYDLAVGAGLLPLTVMHPSSIVSPRASIGPGCQLLPGCIVHTNATLGSNVIVNSGAIVEHDSIVWDHAHIATGARLASTVKVGTGAHIGAGATVIQCRSVGDWAVVGAGAVVSSDVESGAIVAGVPARPLRPRGAGRDGHGG